MKMRHRIILTVLIFLSGGVYGFVCERQWLLSAQSKIADCVKFSDTQMFECIKEAVKNRLNLATLPHVMDMVIDASKTPEDPSGLFSCHNMAHAVGELVSRKEDNSKLLIAACSNVCKYGCVHAVIMSSIRKDPAAVSRPDAFCDFSGFKAEENDQMLNCYHGLGHTFAELSSYDLTSSLKRCKTITREGFQNDCAGGIFMEIFQPPLSNHPAQLPPSDIAEFCSQLPQEYEEFCVIDNGVLQYEITKIIEQGAAICHLLMGEGKQRCARVLGHAVYERAFGQYEKIFSECEKTNELVSACLTGTIESSLKLDPSGSRAKALCEMFPGLHTNICEQMFLEAQESQ